MLLQYGKEKLLSADQDALEIEVWSYDLDRFTTERVCLTVSLCINRDERVEVALDDMMKGIAW